MREITRELVSTLLPPRPKTSHKGDFGRVLVLAGSAGYSGAAAFCALAAVRGGAGLTRAGVPEVIWNQVAAQAPECMCFPLPCDREGRLSAGALDWALDNAGRSDVTVCGPGLGRSACLETLVGALTALDKPLILDADGINNLRGHILNCPLVLTPHEGEFARAGGGLGDGREAGGEAFIKKVPCVLVLKGHRTLVFAPGEETRENTTGGPGLSKGGSGDVLAGLIAALTAQGLRPFDAATAGVYLHGLAGDICEEEIGERGMTASDLLLAIPKALRQTGG
ncbi:MAG: NAD(P)H-hydrate dehydratase [Oscillospiraceae bacterium]|nr:NAD(P)H-hydrate dehydratase [Oscillospiraceae bacterium]